MPTSFFLTSVFASTLQLLYQTRGILHTAWDLCMFIHFRDYRTDRLPHGVSQAPSPSVTPDPGVMETTEAERDTSTNTRDYDGEDNEQPEVGGYNDEVDSGVSPLPGEGEAMMPTIAPKAAPVFPEPEPLPAPPSANTLEVALGIVTLAAVAMVLLTLLKFSGNLGGVALNLRGRLF